MRRFYTLQFSCLIFDLFRINDLRVWHGFRIVHFRFFENPAIRRRP